MERGKTKRQEEYHTDLAVDRLFDFPAAHADFLHNLVPVAVLKSFGNLLIIDNQYRCHQKQPAKENAKEEEASVERMEIFFIHTPKFYITCNPVIIPEPVCDGRGRCFFLRFTSIQNCHN